MIRCLSLFSGIGGIDLGLEATGRFEIVAQSEINPYASRVLSKHWPDIPNLGDITEITEKDFEQIGQVDLVCGGFPCQDISLAGKRKGITAARSGLFFELMRIVRLARPRYVLLENVPALLSRAEWMGAVLGELSKSGFNAQWDCIPAKSCGAHHRRDRVFIVAVANAKRLSRAAKRGEREDASSQGSSWGDDGERGHGDDERKVPVRGTGSDTSNDESEVLADADLSGLEGRDSKVLQERSGQRPAWSGSAWPRPAGKWLPEPSVGRVAYGVPGRVDRLKGLGNAVVPQVATYIAKRILEIEDDRVS